jgi:hypothetical protein
MVDISQEVDVAVLDEVQVGIAPAPEFLHDLLPPYIALR